MDMSWFLLYFFLLGTILGSFLNVVLCRTNTGRSLTGRSHCLSCTASLAWYELIPVFSYLLQRGRCRHCGARISVQYFAVELATGLVYVWVAAVFFGDLVSLVLNLIFATLLLAIAAYDLRHSIIPDRWVCYAAVVALVVVGWEVVATATVLPFVSAILGSVLAAALLGMLWLVSRGRWIGLGDVKLVIPLGFMVGLWGSLSVLVFAFWIGAVVGVGLLGIRWLLERVRGQSRLPFITLPRTMKSEVPFAPFLILAFFLVHLCGVHPLMLIDTVLALIG